MKAVGYSRSLAVSDPDLFAAVNLPLPEPGPRDLRVAVRAVSVNPVDTKIRMRVNPEGKDTKIIGWDAAGVVDAVGTEVAGFKPGDEVYYSGALDRPGCNSEFHLVDERLVGPKPKSLDFAEAAAMPLTAITAWELLFDRLGVTRESTGNLLVVGGAGGVGSMLIQIARQLTQLTVIATASRPETRAWCQSLGAHHVVDHRQPLDKVVPALNLGPMHTVAALTQTDTHQAAIAEILAPHGKVGIIDDPEHLDAMLLKRKAASLHWEFMFARSLFQTPDMAEQGNILSQIAKLVDTGKLRTTLKQNLGPLTPENLRKAHALLESGSTIGKVVLEGI